MKTKNKLILTAGILFISSAVLSQSPCWDISGGGPSSENPLETGGKCDVQESNGNFSCHPSETCTKIEADAAVVAEFCKSGGSTYQSCSGNSQTVQTTRYFGSCSLLNGSAGGGQQFFCVCIFPNPGFPNMTSVKLDPSGSGTCPDDPDTGDQ